MENAYVEPRMADEGEWYPVTFKDEPALFLTLGGAGAVNVALYAGALYGNPLCCLYVAGCLTIYAAIGAWMACRSISEHVAVDTSAATN